MSHQFEVEVHWSDHEPVIRGHLGSDQVHDLLDQLAVLAPHELSRAHRDGSDPVALLLGLQNFFRLALVGDGCVALAGTDGALWTVPARNVRGIRVRLVELPAASTVGTMADIVRVVFADSGDATKVRQ